MISKWNAKGTKNKETKMMHELEKWKQNVAILSDTKKKGIGEDYLHI